MKDKKATGEKGEQIACKYLKRQGFRLVKKNMILKAGEIDLVMQDGSDLVLVEVRTIRSLEYGDPEERIPFAKRRQLIRLAKYYLATLKDPLPPVRIDLCVVVLEPEVKVYHYQDALRVNDYHHH